MSNSDINEGQSLLKEIEQKIYVSRLKSIYEDYYAKCAQCHKNSISMEDAHACEQAQTAKIQQATSIVQNHINSFATSLQNCFQSCQLDQSIQGDSPNVLSKCFKACNEKHRSMVKRVVSNIENQLK